VITLESNGLICSWSQLHAIKEGNIGHTSIEKTDGSHCFHQKRISYTIQSTNCLWLWQNLLFPMKFNFILERRKQNEKLYHGTGDILTEKALGCGWSLWSCIPTLGCSSTGNFSLFNFKMRWLVRVNWGWGIWTILWGSQDLTNSCGVNSVVLCNIKGNSRSEYVQVKNHKN